MAQPVTQEEWSLIKSKLEYMEPWEVMDAVKRHITTISRVQASPNYERYKEMVAAERQPRLPGKLREDVDDLLKRVKAIEVRLGMDKDGCEG